MNNNTLSLCDEGTRPCRVHTLWLESDWLKGQAILRRHWLLYFFFFFHFLQQTGLLPDTKERNGPSTGLHQPSCPCLRKENWDLLRPRSMTNVFLQISKFFSQGRFSIEEDYYFGWVGGSTGGGTFGNIFAPDLKRKKESLTKRITASFITRSQSQVLWVQNKRWCDCRDDLAAPGLCSALI